MIRYHIKNQILVLAFSFITLNLFSQQFVEQTNITLPGVREGSVAWGDYDNDGDLDLLLTGTTDGTGTGAISKIYRNEGGNIFTEQTNISLIGIYDGSAAWGDYDKDGYLDILLTGNLGAGGKTSKVYHNNGNNTFTEQSGISLTDVMYSAAAWGDYDNDGSLDILLTGNNGITNIAKIYCNKGNNTFTEQANISLAGVMFGSVAWIDYNNDGYNDIVLMGNAQSGAISKIYKNNGDNSFTEQTDIKLDGMYQGSIAAGDFDNDGYTDLLLAGASLCKIYHNNGNNTFTALQNNVFPGIVYGSIIIGDYDNDGDLDFLLTGSPDGSGSDLILKIYRNEGLNVFSEQNVISSPGIYYSSVAWADYDNDGDLDILLTGSTGTENITKIYRNEIGTHNTKPSTVTSFLPPEINGAQVTLKWNHATDNETPWQELTYNIKVGTSTGDSDIINPQSQASGKMKIVAHGNVQSNTFLILKNLKKADYFWSVQALDNSFAGGSFSAEQTFTISAENQASDITLKRKEGTTLTVWWNRGNGEKCIVFARKGNNGTVSLTNTTTYSANPNFGSGAHLTDDWYCVYNGTDDEVKVTNLEALTDYIFQVVEYEGNPGSELYYSASGVNNPLVFKTTFFTEQTGISLPGTYSSNIAFGDYDNDGDLDILLTGSVYTNNGDNTFTLLTDLEIGLTGSGAWGDYDNDGYLDVLIAGFASSGRITKIFRNNHNSTFTEQTAIALTGVGQGSVAWGDYDNDGDLDILMTGNSDLTNITKIYRNNGNNSFTEQVGISLIGVKEGVALWGDYDNDGSLDILVSGNQVTKIYHNNKDNSFTELTGISLTGYSLCSAAWGDYDNDGDLDILISGSSTIGTTSKIYRNNGNSTFTEQTQIPIVGAYYGSVTWGDIDNDGYLDFIVTGQSSAGFVSKIYKNNTDNTFTELTDISLDLVRYSSVAFGDYDNDNDLDIILNGRGSGTNIITKIYRNEINVPDKLPEAPAGLISNLSGTQLNLSWEKVNNDETPSNALSYNVRLGRVSGGNQIISSHSSASGYRRIVAMGNAGEHLSYRVNNIYPGSYFWSVQAVDNSFKGGAFSAEETIVVDSIQAHNLSASTFNNTSLLIRWQRGNGTRCIVFCKQGSMDVAKPAHNTTYVAETTFGNGDEIPGGWFCVYNGKNDSVIINGLITNSQYAVAVIEYLGSSGNEKYYRENRDDNNGSFGTGMFTEQSGINIIGLMFSSVTWADYDNDGYLDFLVSGMDNSYNTRTKVFRNNGNNTFSEQTEITLDQFAQGHNEWGDFDNDGDLDLLLTGWSSGPTSKIYRNNNDNTFTEQTGISLTGIGYGSVAWGDYDNDGDLDILLSGQSISNQKISKIYLNNGNSTFTEQTAISLPGLASSSIAWGDYDNDGYLDFFLSGLASTGLISKIYHNNGNNTFTQKSEIPITGVMNGSAAWGDYDGDGDLDLLISGGTSNAPITKIYRNDNGITFTEQTNLHFTGVEYSSVAWGDYDNDGDLDILVTGYLNPGCISKIYRNNNDNTFTEQTGISLTGIGYGSVAWGDYDNDGDLDILLSGSDATGNPVTKIYRNNTIMKTGNYQVNQAPAKPVNLKSQFFPDKVVLAWSPVTGDETPSKTMSYNVRVRKSGETLWKAAPQSAETGVRRVAAMGNAQLDTTYSFKSLDQGTYYWCVQAVDQGFKGGEWSDPELFIVKTVQAFYTANSVCKGFPTIFIDQSQATDGIKSWLWDFKDGQTSTLQNPEHTFASAGTYKVKLTVVSNTDVSDILEQDVIVKPKPVAVFSAPAVCVGYATTFTNNTTWPIEIAISQWSWNFGDGQNSSSQSPGTHLYSFPNTYPVKLQVLADNGCSDEITQDVVVASYPNAVVSAIGALLFCVGDSVNLSVPNQTGCTYQWKNGSVDIIGATSNKLTVKSITGTYKAVVTTTSAGCISNTVDPVSITVNQPPAPPYISNSGSITFCQGDSVTLSVTNITGYTYQWKLNGGAVGTNSYQYSAKSAGTYSLVISNSSGCSASSTNTINVVVNSKPSVPTVNVSGATSFCQGGSVDLSVANNTAYNYQWKNNSINISGANTNTFSAQNSGVYSLNITNSAGCSSKTDNVTVNVSPSPTAPLISAGSATQFCQGDSVTLSVTNTVGYTYQWKLNSGAVGSNSNQYTAKSAGTYSLVVSNLFGCAANSTNTVNVVVNSKPTVPNVNVSGATSFCQGGSVDLSVTNNPAYNYQWKNNSTNISGANTYTYSAQNSGVYSLNITNSAGCSSKTDNVTVNVSPSPTAPLISSGGSLQFCQGDSVILSVTNTTGYTYQWKLNGGAVGSISNQYTAKSAGTYTLVVLNSYGCSASSTNSVNVVVNSLPAASTVNLSGPTSFCQGGNVQLSVTNNTSYTYHWQNNSTNISGAVSNTYIAQNSGVYSLNIANSSGCVNKTENVTVNSLTAPSAPSISAGGTLQFCQGDSVTLSVTNTTGYTYQWKLNGGSVGSNSNTFVAKNSGSYNLVVSNTNSCSASSSNSVNVVVNNLPAISAVSLSGPTTFCQGGSITLSVPSASGYSYNWRNETGLISGANSYSYLANTSGKYQLDISNTSGCVVRTSQVNVVVKPMPIKPVITSDNYQAGKCMGEDPIRLNVSQAITGYNYQWYKNGIPINGAASSTYEAFLSQSDYTLEADLGGCKSLSDVLNVHFENAPDKPFIYAEGPTVWYLACSNDSASQYKWYYNGTIIQGADKYIYVANRNLGQYAVSIANTKGCFTISDVITIPTGATGIKDIDPFAGLKIYPNPTPGLFTIEMDNQIFGELLINIIAQEGKEILKIKFEKTTVHFSSQINLSGQPKGMYLINLLIDKYNANRKVIVE